jgi:ribonuclease D
VSKTEINALPLRAYGGAVHVVDSDEKALAAERALSAEGVLGFDTETRPAFKSGESYPPSLVQLAASGGVYIFRLAGIADHGPLAGVLADKKILKAGIAISDDIRKLNEVFPFKPSGFVELAAMAAKAGIKNAGVRGLAAALFGFRISKGSRCSRWDAPALTREQIEYAATDAWACREIYLALSAMRTARRA